MPKPAAMADKPEIQPAGIPLKDAAIRHASQSFFGFKAPAPDADCPPDCDMTRDQWEALSPGYRREISRDYQRRNKGSEQ